MAAGRGGPEDAQPSSPLPCRQKTAPLELAMQREAPHCTSVQPVFNAPMCLKNRPLDSVDSASSMAGGPRGSAMIRRPGRELVPAASPISRRSHVLNVHCAIASSGIPGPFTVLASGPGAVRGWCGPSRRPARKMSRLWRPSCGSLCLPARRCHWPPTPSPKCAQPSMYFTKLHNQPQRLAK